MKIGIDVRWLHEAFINATTKSWDSCELNIPPEEPDTIAGLGGVGRYLFELLPRLSRHITDARVILFFLEGSEPPDELTNLWPDSEHTALPSLWRPRGASWGPLWRTFQTYHDIRTTQILSGLELDVFFSPHQLMIPRDRWATRRVITCHDLAYLQFPELFFGGGQIPTAYQDLYERLGRSDCILSVSKTTAQALENLLSIPEERIVITPEGVSERILSPGEPYQPGWEYLLHVGGPGPTKNMRTILDGWRLISETNQELHLILAGTSRDAVSSLIESRGLKDMTRLHCVSPVSDVQLGSLYRGAVMLIMPSIVEGFGLPVLEAMACGCPVIASRSSPMEEVAEDSGIFIDHRSPEQLAYAVTTLLSDSLKRKTMSALGRTIAEQYSWDRTASITADAILSSVSTV